MIKRWAQLTLSWNVITILLGALVRATQSGAGCGRSWPTCSGALIPELSGAAAVEYTHRAASGIALVLVLVLLVMAFGRHGKGAPIRRAAAWAGAAIVGEALIGAAIVLFEWVGADSSGARVVAVPLHLVNTLLLLAALTLVIWFASGGRELGRGGAPRRWLVFGASAFAAIAATGAVTALADTLFPKDESTPRAAAHFLTDLRVLHPLLSLVVVVTAVVAVRLAHLGAEWRSLGILTLGQFGLGALNIALGTPVWIQLLHLLLADLIWISYVWLGAQVLASNSASSSGEAVGLRQTIPEHK